MVPLGYYGNYYGSTRIPKLGETVHLTYYPTILFKVSGYSPYAAGIVADMITPTRLEMGQHAYGAVDDIHEYEAWRRSNTILQVEPYDPTAKESALARYFK